MEKSLFQQLEEGLEYASYWQMLEQQMLPGLSENSCQIGFRVHCRYGVKSAHEIYEEYLSDAIGDGLVIERKVDVMGSGIIVPFYRLTAKGEWARTHIKLAYRARN